jgi:hypothetical protein
VPFWPENLAWDIACHQQKLSLIGVPSVPFGLDVKSIKTLKIVARTTLSNLAFATLWENSHMGQFSYFFLKLRI